MADHTPGPWVIGRGADGFPIVHTAPDTDSPSGQGVAHVCKRAMCQDHIANARLIAAAPDLLEALKAIDAWASNKSAHNERSIIAQVRAAIAKGQRNPNA